MARQVGRAKSAKRGGGVRAKAISVRKRPTGAKRAKSKGPTTRAKAPPPKLVQPSEELLVDKITREIFQTRAAYRADLFAYETDDGLSK